MNWVQDKLPHDDVFTEKLLADRDRHLKGRVFVGSKGKMFATFDEGQTFYQLVSKYSKLSGNAPFLPDSDEYLQWVADPNSICPKCISRQGMIFSVNHDSWDDNESEPPLHPHCNCKLVPLKCMLTKGWMAPDIGVGFEFAKEDDAINHEWNKGWEDEPESRDLTEEEKIFISVVAGEAIGENELSWRAVAHVVMNRLANKRDTWRKAENVTDIVTDKSQFNSYGDPQYKLCMTYLNNRDGTNNLYEQLINTVLLVYYGIDEDITDSAILYYSPKSMVPKDSVPSWVNEKVKEINVVGIDKNSFRFYKYK